MSFFQTDQTPFLYLFLIYLFLFFYAIERSVFAFVVPVKVAIRKDVWLTAVPFLSFTIFFFFAVLEFSISRHCSFYLSFVGFCIFCFGIFIRYWTALSLKAQGQIWLSHIEADYVMKIVKTGAYKHMSHPYYLSVMLELLGICIFLNSFYTFLLVLILQSVFLLKRIKAEESNLATKFGREYLEYKNSMSGFLFRRRK